MLIDYLPILILFIIASVMGVIILSVGWLVRSNKPTKEKLAAYECGHFPVSDARVRIRIRYYIFAMLFVLFDIETVFLFPWAVTFDKIGVIAFVEMMLFIVVLLVGYVYAWKKGALEWDY